MMLGPALGDMILGENREFSNFRTLFFVTETSLVIPALLLLLVEPPAAETRRSSARLKDIFHTIIRCWPGAIVLIVAAFGLSTSTKKGSPFRACQRWGSSLSAMLDGG
jgi:hypothetical protein